MGIEEKPRFRTSTTGNLAIAAFLPGLLFCTGTAALIMNGAIGGVILMIGSVALYFYTINKDAKGLVFYENYFEITYYRKNSKIIPYSTIKVVRDNYVDGAEEIIILIKYIENNQEKQTGFSPHHLILIKVPENNMPSADYLVEFIEFFKSKNMNAFINHEWMKRLKERNKHRNA